MSGGVTVTGLLPCPNPWCEGPEHEGDLLPAMHRGLFDTHYVACTSCCMDGPKCQTEAEAVAAWNTRRSAEAASRDREAALAKAARSVRNLIWCLEAAAIADGKTELAQKLESWANDLSAALATHRSQSNAQGEGL